MFRLPVRLSFSCEGDISGKTRVSVFIFGTNKDELISSCLLCKVTMIFDPFLAMTQEFMCYTTVSYCHNELLNPKTSHCLKSLINKADGFFKEGLYEVQPCVLLLENTPSMEKKKSLVYGMTGSVLYALAKEFITRRHPAK